MEQTAIGQRANQYQRIIYVEPNDVYDKEANNSQQGESLTPKYEDFCISFNLIIESYSRFKSGVVSKDINEKKPITKESLKVSQMKRVTGLRNT